MRKKPDGFVVAPDPCQAFGVGQDGRVAARHDAEHQIAKARRGGVVRRLDKDITGVGEGQEATGAKSRHKIRNNVIVGAADERQRDIIVVERLLEPINCVPDPGAVIMIETGQNMRRAGQC